jgi:hypothetical protein
MQWLLLCFVCLFVDDQKLYAAKYFATRTVRRISSACVLATVYGIVFFFIILAVYNPSGGRREPDFRISGPVRNTDMQLNCACTFVCTELLLLPLLIVLLVLHCHTVLTV